MASSSSVKAEIQIAKLSRAVEQSQIQSSLPTTKATSNMSIPRQPANGITPEEVIGKNPRIFKTGETQEEYKRLWAVMKSGGEWRGEFRNKKNGDAIGSPHPFHLSKILQVITLHCD